jgi:hypothetical protein
MNDDDMNKDEDKKMDGDMGGDDMAMADKDDTSMPAAGASDMGGSSMGSDDSDTAAMPADDTADDKGEEEEDSDTPAM